MKFVRPSYGICAGNEDTASSNLRPEEETSVRYGSVAVALHWTIAGLALAQIALGWWMIGLPDKTGVQRDWFNLHKSIGLTIFALMLVRLAWRLTHPAPPLPGWLPRWQAIAARVNHGLFYGALIAQPVVGYIGSSFTRYPVKYFGVTLPAWGWDAPPIKAFFSGVHLALACLITAAVAVHIAAALVHLLRRDGVFERMWPRMHRTERLHGVATRLS
jgi:cytochrome b561